MPDLTVTVPGDDGMGVEIDNSPISEPRWLSPTGEGIQGTLERIRGVANIIGISDDGVPEYDGGTTVFWDEQRTMTRHGKPLFLDRAGEVWTFDQLTRETAE